MTDVPDPLLAARLNEITVPPLPADFADKAIARALAPENPARGEGRHNTGLPKARRVFGRTARPRLWRVTAGGTGAIALAMISISAAAMGYFGEPLRHAVHHIPLVGRVVERVVPEKHRHHFHHHLARRSIEAPPTARPDVSRLARAKAVSKAPQVSALAPPYALPVAPAVRQAGAIEPGAPSEQRSLRPAAFHPFSVAGRSLMAERRTERQRRELERRRDPHPWASRPRTILPRRQIWAAPGLPSAEHAEVPSAALPALSDTHQPVAPAAPGPGVRWRQQRAERQQWRAEHPGEIPPWRGSRPSGSFVQMPTAAAPRAMRERPGPGARSPRRARRAPGEWARRGGRFGRR